MRTWCEVRNFAWHRGYEFVKRNKWPPAQVKRGLVWRKIY